MICIHDPACPAADAVDWWAARNTAVRPSQGWTLLCNGALVFDDQGALLPDGRVAAISHRSAERMQHVFHELHAEGRHALCAICA